MNEVWEALRLRLMRQFRSFALAEDIVQEALFRTSLRFAGANDIQNLEAFAVGVARNIVREMRHREQRDVSYQVAAPESTGASFQAPDEPDLSLIELNALKHRVFSTSERKLFDAYSGKTHAQRERLAAKLGIRLETLCVKMHRLKKRLKDEHLRTSGGLR